MPFYPRLVWLIAVIVLAELSSCTPVDETSQSSQSVIGGVSTFESPQIGRLDNGCTATLVGSRVILTAAHCVSPKRWNQADFPLQGRISGNFIVDRDATTSHSYRLAQYRSFGRTVIDDIAVVQLRDPVPRSVAVPSSITKFDVRVGDAITLWGYGCDSLDPQAGGGVKRKFPTTVLSAEIGSARLCFGDSGGPLMSWQGIVRINSHIKTLDTNANEIADVNNGDLYANPLLLFDQIWAQIQSFNSTPPPAECGTFGTSGECTQQDCEWYSCNTCRDRGTDPLIACPSLCGTIGTLPDCNAAGCVWFACSNSCWLGGTPIQTACPCAGLDETHCFWQKDHCTWFPCSQTCWDAGTSVETACPTDCGSAGQQCVVDNAGSGGSCCPGLSCVDGICLQSASPSISWDCTQSAYAGQQFWTCSNGARYRCSGGTPEQQICEAGCFAQPVGKDDLCITHTTSWDCASSSYGGNQYWTCSGGALYRCDGSQPTRVVCPSGCATQPLGTNDVCN